MNAGNVLYAKKKKLEYFDIYKMKCCQNLEDCFQTDGTMK